MNYLNTNNPGLTWDTDSTETKTSGQKTKRYFTNKCEDIIKHCGSNNNFYYDYYTIARNYDLYNGVIDQSDYESITNPYEYENNVKEISNKDIVSSKVKALLGMEMKRAFEWKVLAVNPEATSRKEQQEAKLLREYVISQIVFPIERDVRLRKAQETQGRPLTEQEQQQLEQEIQQEIKTLTPDEIRKYMEREHQDPSEVLSNHLLKYLLNKSNAKTKFTRAFLHGLLSAYEVAYVGIIDGEPNFWIVSPQRFRCSKNRDSNKVQDSEWAYAEYYMSPHEVVAMFGDQLKKREIDEIYEQSHRYGPHSHVPDNRFFDLSDEEYDRVNNNNDSDVRVAHTVWKGLRKIGYLQYIDEDGIMQEKIVDESYKLIPSAGDVKLIHQWVPEIYECWKIGQDIYVHWGAVPGQFRDLKNLNNNPLPYIGIIYDDLDSTPTSLMDRLYSFQKYYNIINFRIEDIIAKDKGKRVVFNETAIPKNKNIDLEKWQYYFDSIGHAYLNPSEEGQGFDVRHLAAVLDLSTTTQLNAYIELAEYIRTQAGVAVGITPQVEGQMSPYDGKATTQQSLLQTSNILEPYFQLHNEFKKDVLTHLLELSKVAYIDKEDEYLSYVLDDMSLAMFKLDGYLLQNSTYGLFVNNSSKSEDVRQAVQQLAHAAMQNNKATLSDLISVMQMDSTTEMKEVLKAAEKELQDVERALQQQAERAMAQENQKARDHEMLMKEFDRETDLMLKDKDIEKEIIKGAQMGMSYNPDTDLDNDGENDFFEIMKHGKDAEIKAEQNSIKRDELKFKREELKEKVKLENKKINKSTT